MCVCVDNIILQCFVSIDKINPFKYEAQTALFKDPGRTAQ